MTDEPYKGKETGGLFAKKTLRSKQKKRIRKAELSSIGLPNQTHLVTNKKVQYSTG